jgi:hypothetical protein
MIFPPAAVCRGYFTRVQGLSGGMTTHRYFHGDIQIQLRLLTRSFPSYSYLFALASSSNYGQRPLHKLQIFIVVPNEKECCFAYARQHSFLSLTSVVGDAAPFTLGNQG